MKWLTHKQVKQAAKESPEAAIACSILHYEQIQQATIEDIEAKESMFGGAYCALCRRYCDADELELLRLRCRNCPLLKAGYYCNEANSPWRRVMWTWAHRCDPHGEDDFRKAVDNMLTILKSLKKGETK